jgi:hypothetical protein
LSAFFQFTPTSVIDLADEERPVDERVDKRRLYYRQLVKDAPEVLTALTTKLEFLSDSTVPSGSNKKLSQKQVKARRAAEAKAKAPLNPGPFERLEIPVPETREDVEEAVEIILTTQETILEVSSPCQHRVQAATLSQEYLKALGNPELEASIQAACLPDELDLPSEREVEEAQAEQATAEAQTAASADPESLYPAAAQLMKLFASHLYDILASVDNSSAQRCIATARLVWGNGPSVFPLVENETCASIIDGTGRYLGLFSRRSSTCAAFFFVNPH